MTGRDCLFCRIVAGEVPATVVLADAEFIAFRDINPQAPVHILVIPKGHYANSDELAREDPATMGRLVATASQIARREGVADSGYRLVANTGSDGGQTVDHLHLHLLGGRHMTWPPG